LTIGSMEYLPPVQQQPMQVPQSGAHKYHGERVEDYDDEREPDDKWKVEQAIIENMIKELPAGSEILDCPVGTGRFLHAYANVNDYKFIGMDISGDMLYKSARKIDPAGAKAWIDNCDAWIVRCIKTGETTSVRIGGTSIPRVGTQINVSGRMAKLHVDAAKLQPIDIDGKGWLQPGNILNTGLPDKSFDCAINCRITRWIIGDHGPAGIVQMLKEMQRVTRQKIIITARVEGHKWAVSRHLINSALDGWRVAEDAEGYVPEYRIICIEPTV
jgi:ubiquinone/menaquinone biosynthesis C-methylase UbiE